MKLLIHIGFPKSASTWLQEKVFNNEDFKFTSLNRKEIALRFGLPHPFYFCPKEVMKTFKKKITESNSNGNYAVLSNEFLSGNFYLNGGIDSKIYADRLKETFPNAKVLIIIREQISFLCSLYKHDISYNGGFWSISEFVKPDWHFNRRSSFHPRYIKYFGIVKYYQNIFGKSNVLILPFELIQNDKEEFIHKVMSFVKMKKKNKIKTSTEKINKSRSITLIYFQRILNRIFTSRSENTLRLPKGIVVFFNRKVLSFLNLNFYLIDRFFEKKLKKKVYNMMHKYYENDNRKLQRIIDFDLSSYGYNIKK